MGRPEVEMVWVEVVERKVEVLVILKRGSQHWSTLFIAKRMVTLQML